MCTASMVLRAPTRARPAAARARCAPRVGPVTVRCLDGDGAWRTRCRFPAVTSLSCPSPMPGEPGAAEQGEQAEQAEQKALLSARSDAKTPTRWMNDSVDPTPPA